MEENKEAIGKGGGALCTKKAKLEIPVSLGTNTCNKAQWRTKTNSRLWWVKGWKLALLTIETWPLWLNLAALNFIQLCTASMFWMSWFLLFKDRFGLFKRRYRPASNLSSSQQLTQHPHKKEKLSVNCNPQNIDRKEKTEKEQEQIHADKKGQPDKMPFEGQAEQRGDTVHGVYKVHRLLQNGSFVEVGTMRAGENDGKLITLESSSSEWITLPSGRDRQVICCPFCGHDNNFWLEKQWREDYSPLILPLVCFSGGTRENTMSGSLAVWQLPVVGAEKRHVDQNLR